MFGRTVQSFMDREEVGGRPLEILAEMAKAATVERFLLEIAGYTRWKGDFKTLHEYMTRKRFSRRGWDTPNVPASIAQRIENPIRAFFTFHRMSPKHGIQYIRLGICTTCIAKSIITAYETHLSPSKFELPRQDFEQEYVYTRWLGGELGIYKTKNGERSVGDSKCWSIHYDENGETLSGDEELAKVGRYTPERRNKWKLALNKGKVFVKVVYVSRDTFWP
ncbi:hypothetical protein HWV62_8817 [Athelia sp. TMB]|nr:hypothetical protein HWV62_8817 [Athelia sp. TMB]